MVTKAEREPQPRLPLTRRRILGAAIELADAEGIAAVTMRRVARQLGVEAMSLYHHVANKEDLLDGMVDEIVRKIEDELGVFTVEKGTTGWQQKLRHMMLTARRVMLRHPWAPAVIETRTKMPPSLIRYFETILGTMIEGGFSYDLAHHAMHTLGSRALGFNQELFVPDTSAEEQESNEMFAAMMAELPYMVGMLSEISHDSPDSTLGWCDDQTEFEFGIDLILDGLERLRDQGT